MLGEFESTDRRSFVGALGAGAAGLWLPESAKAAQKRDAGDIIAGKNRRLRVFRDNPAVMETPLDLLLQHQITPMEILFLRNNQQPKNAATLRPAPLKGWRIALNGMIDKQRMLSAEDLARMPQTEHEMVLQCAGNGRSLYSVAHKTSGTQWGQGGIGNVRFRGVRLAAIVEQLKIRFDPAVRFIAAEGADEPAQGKADYEHSLPLAAVLEKSILALQMNGEPIPAIHGGPVRLVTPGYYGTMHVKWLSRLRFERGETTNYNHIPRYRTPNRIIRPGTEFRFTLANSTPTYEMKISTIIFSPRSGAKVRAGRNEIRGVSFNDGSARIETVQVSLDRGRTWRRADLQAPQSPYAWYPWRLQVNLGRGENHIWARAIDTVGRSQPIDGSIFWNPRGYQWHGVEKVRVTI